MPDAAAPFAWGHVNLNVASLERSISFYARLGFGVFLPGIPYLGLVREETRALSEASATVLGLPPGTRGRACILQLGDGFPKLDLTELEVDAPAPPAANADRGFVRLCLASRDLGADYERLSAQGVPFVTPPRALDGGLARVAVCRDPDGALIELIQIAPEKWVAAG